MISLEHMSTESRNPRTMHLDQMSIREILTIMNEEDAKAINSIKEVIPRIEEVIQMVDAAFKEGGRLIYIGAGTSGRLGVLDAVECVPTFGSRPQMVQGLIAGGWNAMMHAVEGAEDNSELGATDLQAIQLTDRDVVIGIAASGRTPYVLGALDYASKIGAATVAISCNRNSEIGQKANINIEVIPGPEILTGSTRLKAGTTQKLILNMISTVSMIKQGKVYQNLMVDLIATNEKLKKRSEKIVQEATGMGESIVRDALEKSHGNVKIAILMLILDLSFEEAREQLEHAQGKIRRVINQYQ